MAGKGGGLENPKEWERAISLVAGAPDRIREAARKAILQEAHAIRAKMVRQFDDGKMYGGGDWAPLSPLALAVRRFTGFGGTKILVRTATLRNSISVIPVEQGVFIGISRRAPRADGKDSVDVAKVQEFGAEFQITMTAKQRAFLFAAIAKAGLPRKGGGGGKGSSGGPWVVTVHIPARPFIRPVFDNLDQAELEASIRARMVKLLDGDFG